MIFKRAFFCFAIVLIVSLHSSEGVKVLIKGAIKVAEAMVGIDKYNRYDGGCVYTDKGMFEIHKCYMAWFNVLLMSGQKYSDPTQNVEIIMKLNKYADDEGVKKVMTYGDASFFSYGNDSRAAHKPYSCEGHFSTGRCKKGKDVDKLKSHGVVITEFEKEPICPYCIDEALMYYYKYVKVINHTDFGCGCKPEGSNGDHSRKDSEKETEKAIEGGQEDGEEVGEADGEDDEDEGDQVHLLSSKKSMSSRQSRISTRRSQTSKKSSNSQHQQPKDSDKPSESHYSSRPHHSSKGTKKSSNQSKHETSRRSENPSDSHRDSNKPRDSDKSDKSSEPHSRRSHRDSDKANEPHSGSEKSNRSSKPQQSSENQSETSKGLKNPKGSEISRESRRSRKPKVSETSMKEAEISIKSEKAKAARRAAKKSVKSGKKKTQ